MPVQPPASSLAAPQQSEGGLHPQRILIRGVNWLGDAVMTTPALLRLREKFPAAHVALLCPEKLRDLWLFHPAINEVITFGQGDRTINVANKLRAGGFELALVLPNSPRSALEVFFARIPHRIGLARPWRNCFLTQAVKPRAEAVNMRKRTAAEIKKLVAADVSRSRHQSAVRSRRPQARIKATNIYTWPPRWARIPNRSRRNCSSRRRKSKRRRKSSGWKTSPGRFLE